MSGGLPGNDGAHTICSGVTESPLTDKFSLLSIRFSNSIRKCSDEIADANDNDRSRKDSAGEKRRTDRSRGVDGSLVSKIKIQREIIFVSYEKQNPPINSLRRIPLGLLIIHILQYIRSIGSFNGCPGSRIGSRLSTGSFHLISDRLSS